MKSEHVQASACHFCFIEVITKMKKKPIRCPYCGGTAVLRDASYVYGGESGHKHLYVCQHYPECNAYVGVHEGTLIPLGTLADRELRNKRIRAHQTFDRIWTKRDPDEEKRIPLDAGYLLPDRTAGAHRLFFRVYV